MKTRRTGRRIFSQFKQWVWLLSIFLAACAPISAPMPSEVEATAPSTGEPSFTQPAVAILVVDFFGAPVPHEDGEGTYNCLAGANGTDGAGNHGSTGAAGGLIKASIPHGKMVYDHLTEQFENSFLFTEPFTDVPPERYPKVAIPGLLDVISTTLPMGDVYLAQIEIGTNFTDAVLTKIMETRKWMTQEFGVDNVVVNLSIVVKSCDTLFDGENDEGLYLPFIECMPTLNQQRELFQAGITEETAQELDAIIRKHAEILAAYSIDPMTDSIIEQCDNPEIVEILQEFSAAFERNLAQDPLIAAILGSAGENIFFIAASGNDGFPYPFAPALFTTVASTGSFPSNNPNALYVPNDAEWILDDHYTFTTHAGDDVKIYAGSDAIQVPDETEVTIVGTSFATPKLSFLTAIALLETPVPPMNNCYPLMIYSAEQLTIPWGFWHELGLPHSDIWRNRGVDELSGECGFPDPANTTPPS